jgi:hypothetical protein
MNNNFHVQRQYFPTFQYSQKKLEEGTQDSRQHHFRHIKACSWEANGQANTLDSFIKNWGSSINHL